MSFSLKYNLNDSWVGTHSRRYCNHYIAVYINPYFPPLLEFFFIFPTVTILDTVCFFFFFPLAVYCLSTD